MLNERLDWSRPPPAGAVRRRSGCGPLGWGFVLPWPPRLVASSRGRLLRLGRRIGQRLSSFAKNRRTGKQRNSIGYQPSGSSAVENADCGVRSDAASTKSQHTINLHPKHWNCRFLEHCHRRRRVRSINDSRCGTRFQPLVPPVKETLPSTFFQGTILSEVKRYPPTRFPQSSVSANFSPLFSEYR
jgi:hypothetical protein